MEVMASDRHQIARLSQPVDRLRRWPSFAQPQFPGRSHALLQRLAIASQTHRSDRTLHVILVDHGTPLAEPERCRTRITSSESFLHQPLVRQRLSDKYLPALKNAIKADIRHQSSAP